MSVLVLGFQAVLLLVASRPDCSGHRSRPSRPFPPEVFSLAPRCRGTVLEKPSILCCSPRPQFQAQKVRGFWCPLVQGLYGNGQTVLFAWRLIVDGSLLKAGCVCCRVVSWVRRRKAEPDLFTAVPHCGSSFISGCLTVFCVEVLRFPRLFSNFQRNSAVHAVDLTDVSVSLCKPRSLVVWEVQCHASCEVGRASEAAATDKQSGQAVQKGSGC